MKRIIYIISFSIFGLLVATLLHAGIEFWALAFIFGNPEQFATSVWWTEWTLIHGTVSLVLWGVGLLGGLWAGFTFWRILYVEGKRK